MQHSALPSGPAWGLTRALAESLQKKGGRVLVVGGAVRDLLRGVPSERDIDLEVYGLSRVDLVESLSSFGAISEVGQAFGVLKLTVFLEKDTGQSSVTFDVSLPRVDSKTAPGHRGFVVCTSPHLPFDQAFSRRDFTINSMGWDPLTQELIDPFRGQDDLANGILRPTSSACFADDPLRALRAAQCLARFNVSAAPSLVTSARAADLSELAPERLAGEFDKLLGLGQVPSRGLEFLEETDLLRFFPELNALRGVPQNPEWHPEGDVWIHTKMVIDEAVALRALAGEHGLLLMYAALLHDVGKPACTQKSFEGTIRSTGHETFDPPLQSFAERLRFSKERWKGVQTLVHHHLKPYRMPAEPANAAAYRRLARALQPLPLTLLALLARADLRGRGPSVRSREKIVDDFLQSARLAGVEHCVLPAVVKGRDLARYGIPEGTEMGTLLKACLTAQDEHGLTDPDELIHIVLNFPKT